MTLLTILLIAITIVSFSASIHLFIKTNKLFTEAEKEIAYYKNLVTKYETTANYTLN